MFAKSTGKGLYQRLYFNKAVFQRLQKRDLAQVFSCEFSKISKNTFLQNTSGRLLLLLAFQKQPPKMLYEKKCYLKISQKSQGNTFGLRNFQKRIFYRIPLDDYFWLFRATLLKGILPTVFGKPQINIHYLETLTLEVPFRYIISFFSRMNFQCMSSLALTVYCQKQP